MRKVLFLICFFYFAETMGQDSIIKPIYNEGIQTEISDINANTESKVDLTSSADSDFVWNKWDTKNFIVLSIDKSQGLFLKRYVEDVKISFQERWGLKKYDFSTQCKILCVPDNKFLFKFFNIEQSHAEVKKNSEGLFSSAIWVSYEEIDKIDYLISSVCLDVYSSKFFVKRGIIKLENKSIESLKNSLSNFNEININEVLETDENKWLSLSSDQKEKFDNAAAVLCLLLRREFGIDKFSLFVNSKQEADDIVSIYGFSDLESFSKTLNRYAKNLSEDIKSGRTPNKYLILK
jgi:hypothetical protein